MQACLLGQDFVSGPDGNALNNCDVIPSSISKQERISGDLALEIGEILFFRCCYFVYIFAFHYVQE